MNIEKIGDKLIDVFVENQLVKCFSDIYSLKKEDLLKLDRQGEKSVDNILSSIGHSKKVSLNCFIYALGIRYVGEQTAKTLAQYFKTIKEFKNLADIDIDKKREELLRQELLTCDDVGPKVCDSIIKFLQNKKLSKEIKSLIDAGITIKSLPKKTTQADLPLNGEVFVITGTLPRKRQEIQKMIEEFGGQNSSSINKKTSYLVCGEEAGSKKEKAKKLGITILTWSDFLELTKTD